jgi:hypothetical protein
METTTMEKLSDMVTKGPRSVRRRKTHLQGAASALADAVDGQYIIIPPCLVQHLIAAEGKP